MKVVEKLVSLGIEKKNAIAILKGYEGIEKTWEMFKEDFYGRDLMLKTKMAISGKYDAWFDVSKLSTAEKKILSKKII